MSRLNWSRVFALLLLCVFGLCGELARADDLYSILGISRYATADELKRAYRKVALENHPDRNPNDPVKEERFKKAAEAYEILSDPERRALYDRTGSTKASKTGGSAWAASEPIDPIRRRDEAARKYTNLKWTYDFETHRYYDNRTHKWLNPDPIFNDWRSDEGWIFYESTGVYYDADMRGEWNPDSGQGWFRSTNNYGGSVKIDPNTGFTLSVRYEPGTISDVSDQIDRALNPVNYIRAKKGIVDRKSHLDQLNSVKWTDSRLKDLRERIHTHLRVLNHPDMAPYFGTDYIYHDAFVRSILEVTLRIDPSFVKDVLNNLSDSQHLKTAKEYLLTSKTETEFCNSGFHQQSK